MYQVHQQIKKLAGWTDAGEEANLRLAFVRSKKEFVE
jgi:hypothetical protein